MSRLKLKHVTIDPSKKFKVRVIKVATKRPQSGMHFEEALLSCGCRIQHLSAKTAAFMESPRGRFEFSCCLTHAKAHNRLVCIAADKGISQGDDVFEALAAIAFPIEFEKWMVRRAHGKKLPLRSSPDNDNDAVLRRRAEAAKAEVKYRGFVDRLPEI